MTCEKIDLAILLAHGVCTEDFKIPNFSRLRLCVIIGQKHLIKGNRVKG